MVSQVCTVALIFCSVHSRKWESLTRSASKISPYKISKSSCSLLSGIVALQFFKLEHFGAGVGVGDGCWDYSYCSIFFVSEHGQSTWRWAWIKHAYRSLWGKLASLVHRHRPSWDCRVRIHPAHEPKLCGHYSVSFRPPNFWDFYTETSWKPKCTFNSLFYICGRLSEAVGWNSAGQVLIATGYSLETLWDYFM